MYSKDTQTMASRIFESEIQTGYTNSKCYRNESETYNVLKTYVNHDRLYIRIKLQMNQGRVCLCVRPSQNPTCRMRKVQNATKSESEIYIIATIVKTY